MYGTQTCGFPVKCWFWFENDVKMYGTQTYGRTIAEKDWFENDVKMYGTQTVAFWRCNPGSLRMM